MSIEHAYYILMTSQQAQEFLSGINENPKAFRTAVLYKISFYLPVLNAIGDVDAYREAVNENWLDFSWKDKQFLVTCLDAVITRMFALGWHLTHLETYRVWENAYGILKEGLYGKNKPYNKVYDIFYESYGTKNELADMMQKVLADKVKHDFCSCNVTNFTWSDLTRRFMIGVFPNDVDEADFCTKEYYACTPVKKGEELIIYYTKVDFLSYYSWSKRWRLGNRRTEANMATFELK